MIPRALRVPRLSKVERQGYALPRAILSGNGASWLLHSPDCAPLTIGSRCTGCAAIECSWTYPGQVRVRPPGGAWLDSDARAFDLHTALVLAIDTAARRVERPTRTRSPLGPRPSW